jgi:hypothetical protein
VLVNSGTSTYESGPERLRQRGTAAHNTILVDGRNSSDVWSSFRVGRRARPGPLSVYQDGGAFVASCSHDGYRSMGSSGIHRRSVRLAPSGLSVIDSVPQGVPSIAFWRFASGLAVDSQSGTIANVSRTIARFSVVHGRASIHNSTWHPFFGSSLPCFCLQVAGSQGRFGLNLSWDDSDAAGVR